MSRNSPEVETLLRELDDSLNHLRSMLNSINNFNQEDREKKLNKCQVLIKSIRTTKEALQIEARNLQPSAKTEIQEAMKIKLRTFKELVDFYENKKFEIDRNVLQTDGPSDYTMDSPGGNRNDLLTLAAQGDAIQDQTDAAITNMGQLVADAQQVAEATDAKLEAQTAQMQNIGVNLGTVQANTKRAGATVASIARTAANDLCIQILCGSIGVCVVTIIILVSV